MYLRETTEYIVTEKRVTDHLKKIKGKKNNIIRNIFNKYYLLLVFVRYTILHICLSRACIPKRLFLIINVNKKSCGIIANMKHLEHFQD